MFDEVIIRISFLKKKLREILLFLEYHYLLFYISFFYWVMTVAGNYWLLYEQRRKISQRKKMMTYADASCLFFLFLEKKKERKKDWFLKKFWSPGVGEDWVRERERADLASDDWVVGGFWTVHVAGWGGSVLTQKKGDSFSVGKSSQWSVRAWELGFGSWIGEGVVRVRIERENRGNLEVGNECIYIYGIWYNIYIYIYQSGLSLLYWTTCNFNLEKRKCFFVTSHTMVLDLEYSNFQTCSAF